MTGRFCILVIEADAGLRQLFKVLFEEYLTFFPETPWEAHRLLREARYDLLILDEDSGDLRRRWGFSTRPSGPTLLIAPDRPVNAPPPDAPPRLALPKPFAVQEVLNFVKAIHTAWSAP